MIVTKNKNYEQHSSFPNADFSNTGGYIVDETTAEGRALAEKIKKHAPYFDFVLDENGELIDITPIERPPEPEQSKAPTPEERLQALEDAMLALTLGGM